MAMILNNADWLMNLNYIDFLRGVGYTSRQQDACRGMLKIRYE